MKRALITGIAGQDGTYLAELLAAKGYEVHGTVRTNSLDASTRGEILRKIQPAIVFHEVDLLESGALERLVRGVQPQEIYNLAAQSFVRASFETPEYTAEATGLGAVRILESIRNFDTNIRYYQASSSEMFGKALVSPQNETTPFHPRSPYAAAKAFAYWMTVNYRDAYHIHASNGILFNHESPRRAENFVSRKITRAAARIVAGRGQALRLGNLDARRDWGHAKDYVRAMWLIMQQPNPGDFVIATGTNHSVREMVGFVFDSVGLDWTKYVTFDSEQLRPTEVDALVGDPSKAHKVLGWKPEYDFYSLLTEMLTEDLKLEGLIPEEHLVSTPSKLAA